MKNGLDSHDEHWFLKWFRDWAQRTGISMNPDDPKSRYDYRAAWRARANPVWDEQTKQYSWPPEYKIHDDAQNINVNITLNGLHGAVEEKQDGI